MELFLTLTKLPENEEDLAEIIDKAGNFLLDFVNFYQSDDGTYDEGDPLLKSVSTGNIRAAMSKAIRLSINLPTGETASGKYVIAIIDPDNTLKELDETNNVVVSRLIP